MVTYTVTSPVDSKPPCPFYGGETLSPQRVNVVYWPPENGSGWVLGDVAVYGRRIEDGKPGPMHVKAVFWSDTLTYAPLWVQAYVAENLPSTS